MHEEDSAEFQHVRMCPWHVSYICTNCGNNWVLKFIKVKTRKNFQVVSYITLREISMT